MAFIQERFTNQDMSLDFVANEFSLSTKSVGMLLKKETGMSYLQFVSKLRITYAKKLLIETDMPISEITNAVGYIDTASFSRKFKQAEQIPPQEYRESFNESKGRYSS